MGFTALDGLMMGTRCGSLDPGVLLYLMESKRHGCSQGADQAALQGIRPARRLRHQPGHAHPARQPGTRKAERGGRPVLLPHRARARLAGAALGGLDALVFTGGIGEHAAPVREARFLEAQENGFVPPAASTPPPAPTSPPR
jgi:acetate kinase